MNRSIVQRAREKGDKIVLTLGAITAYALAFVPPYSTTDIGLVVLAAAPVLAASWLFGFAGGLAAALLSFPFNAHVLNLTGQDGWALLSRPGALQGSVLVLVLGVVVGGLRDVAAQLQQEASARRATEAAREETDARYRKLADSASDGILTMDPDWSVLYANPRAGIILGRPPEEMEGVRIVELFDWEQRENELARVLEYVARLRAGARQGTLELTLRRPDGVLIDTEVSIGEATQDGAPIFTAIVRDVTERKRFERELQEARVEALRATRAKSEFISRMSHELRTPLNSIIGYAQLLDTSGLPEDDRDGMTQIVRAGRHLLALVDEVLDIARIEAGRLSLTVEPLDPADVAAQARDLIRPRAAERNVDISICDNLHATMVMADQQRLRQVMLNLISNGVKYNRAGGQVRVGGRVEGGHLRITVEDDGPGVPAELVPRLYTPFDRLDAERTGVEGTGVGLSLVQHLVQAMNGQVGYEPSATGGACFWFTMPRATAVAEAVVSERESAPNIT